MLIPFPDNHFILRTTKTNLSHLQTSTDATKKIPLHLKGTQNIFT